MKDTSKYTSTFFTNNSKEIPFFSISWYSTVLHVGLGWSVLLFELVSCTNPLEENIKQILRFLLSCGERQFHCLFTIALFNNSGFLMYM